VVEILVVVAIVALLLGLLLPGLASARHAADRARTRMGFAQWTTAIEAFRAEYGDYPHFDASGTVNGGAASTAGGEHPFHDVLAGRRRDGSPLGSGAAAAQNLRRIEFHAFGAAEFSGPDDAAPHLLRDASGATSIAVLVDRNRDGRVDGSDYAVWPEVLTSGGEAIRPGERDIPASGVRAGVLFYSADPLASRAAPRFVRSW
jgi:type II secretory pathway pseudopilin PulG